RVRERERDHWCRSGTDCYTDCQRGRNRSEQRLLGVYRKTHRGRTTRRRNRGIVTFASVACVSPPNPDRIYSLHYSSSPSSSRPLLLFLMNMPGWRRNLTFCLQRMHEEDFSGSLEVCSRASLAHVYLGTCCFASRCAHTCHHWFVPPFRRRLREATDSG
ncbi:Protein BOI2, partial [Dissostichus eleginoides]